MEYSPATYEILSDATAAVPRVSREELVRMAKLAKRTKRYEQMVEIMKTVATEACELTAKERNLLSIAYKKVTGARFDALDILSSSERKQESRGKKSHVSGESGQHSYRCMRSKIKSELLSICDGILRLLDDRLIPSASTAESKVFYLKMSGDYHSHLADLKTGVARGAAVENALSSYESAQHIAVAKLDAIHPIRLDVAASLSLFYYEKLNSTDKACSLAKQAYGEAYKILFNGRETETEVDWDDYAETFWFMQILFFRYGCVWTSKFYGLCEAEVELSDW